MIVSAPTPRPAENHRGKGAIVPRAMALLVLDNGAVKVSDGSRDVACPTHAPQQHAYAGMPSSNRRRAISRARAVRSARVPSRSIVSVAALSTMRWKL